MSIVHLLFILPDNSTVSHDVLEKQKKKPRTNQKRQQSKNLV